MLLEPETETEKFRREWAENSGDWAFQVLNFLKGMRKNEVTVEEIVTTKLYERSSPRERDALKWVAGQAENLHPISTEDSRRLRYRDDFLMRFVDNNTLGHRDWVTALANIPAAVERAQRLDASLFPHSRYSSPKIFGWIFR